MFGNFLDKMDSWVGRSFLIGAYLPFLIFGIANILMAQLLYPEQLHTIVHRLTTDLLGPIDATFAFLAICAILAYVTLPFVRIMIGAMRGDFFFRPLRSWLLADQRKIARSLEQDYDETGDASLELNDENVNRLRNRLRAAKEAGQKLGMSTPLPEREVKGRYQGFRRLWGIGPSVDVRIAVAQANVSALVKKRDTRKPIRLDELERAVDALDPALRAYCAEKTLLIAGEPADRRAADRLYRIYADLMDVMVYARDHSRIEYMRARKRKNDETSSADFFPTSFGNRYAALANYFDRRFNIDLEFLLPILQIVVQNDANASTALGRAQQQLEFAVRIFIFVIVFTASWLVLAGLRPGAAAATLAVGTAGFFGVMLTYEIIAASLRSFAETTRAVFVLKRFDLLKALHMPIPATWAEEKVIWDNLSRQLQWNLAPETSEAKQTKPPLTYSNPSDAK
jgi:hypothetical protein